MGLLDYFGLGSKKARPVGASLEKGQSEDPRERQRNIAVKIGIFLVLLVLALLAFPTGDRIGVTVQEGDVWRQDAKSAPFSFAIYKHPDTLAAERRQVRRTTPPFFREVIDARERTIAHRDSLQQELDSVFEAYEQYLQRAQEEGAAAAAEDSIRHRELRRAARVRLSSTQWALLETEFALQQRSFDAPTRAGPDDEPLYRLLLREAANVAAELQQTGVLDVPKDSLHAEDIIVRNVEERTQRPPQPLEDFVGLVEAYDLAHEYMSEAFADRPELSGLFTGFFRAIFVPTHEYMQAETMREIQAREARISPTRGRVDQGEVIVREGERVTPEIRQKLVSLEQAQREQLAGTIAWKQSLGNILLILTTFAIFFLYVYLVRPKIFFDNSKIFLIALFFAAIIGMFAVGVRYPTIGMYAVPVAIVSVLLTVIFDSRVGFFGTITLGLLGGVLLGYDFEYTFATIFAGAIAVFSVRDIKNRGQFFVSAGLVLGAYLVVLAATWLLYDTPLDILWRDTVRVAGNSFLLVLAYPLLWVFERTFNITTDLTLLELSDTNLPLLKELSLRAPGSFNHVLQVANLSEAGATAVGANALLTRVGALYHDIGKMLKPEYFVENQRTGKNPHDELKPKLSALIIASHVKEGLEMGRQYNLPQPVLDFISTHHGTSRIEYFYRKAVEQAGGDESAVPESEFRYPGPIPYSKETGIVMLADSLEAACRSLTDPTHKRLESMIDTIFQSRIQDGQLDDTDLTFQDLKKIKQTFLSMLLGIHHVRVKYPGQDQEIDEQPDTAEPLPSRLIQSGPAPVVPQQPSSLTTRDLKGGTLHEVSPEPIPADPSAPLSVHDTDKLSHGDDGSTALSGDGASSPETSTEPGTADPADDRKH